MATAAAPSVDPSFTRTIENVQIYREYKEVMNKFTSKLDEILYICDMIDVDRIDQFLINFLETYNFYKGKKDDDTEKEEDDTEKEEDDIGYSDLSEKNIESIKKNKNFQKMTTYISTNSENIKKMCNELNDLNAKIEKYLDNATPTDATIKTDILKQKQNIIEQLEKIIRLLEIRTNSNSIAPLPFEKLKFYDVALINKNDIICAIDGYWLFKPIYKKLHVLNNEDSQLNNKFDEVFKYEFYIIYTSLHEDFKETLETDKPNITNIINNIEEIKEAFNNYPLTTQQSP
jgi:vacuolar-type H+-ATPase subunit I/STV1